MRDSILVASDDATAGSAEGMVGEAKKLAKHGIIGVAIDARYHGGRSGGAKGAAAYNKAITQAWLTKPGQPMEHPFYYDTCWDIWRTVDYLETRADVNPKKLGIIGFSMGGIETWLAASVDDRVKVVVPAISIQSFRWSLDNDAWQGRAKTIKAAHDAAVGTGADGFDNLIATDLHRTLPSAGACRRPSIT